MSKVLTDQIEKRTGGTAMDVPATGKWPTANIADDAIGADQLASNAVVNASVATGAAIATSKVSGAVTSIASNGLATSATTDTTNASNISSGTLADARFTTTGTWTPVFAGSGTAGSFTYTAQIGHYTKIGNVVVAQFRVAISAIGVAAAGYLYIQGLPFAAYEYPGIVFSAIRNFTSGDVPSGGYVQSSTDYMQLMRYDSADPRTGWNTHCGGTALTTTSEIHGIVTYRTSAL